jgi:hypothetical protein
MEFYWAGSLFWTLIGVALLFLVYGLWKKSRQALIISGIVILLPMLYFGGAENWFRLLVLVPMIPFILAHYTKKY